MLCKLFHRRNVDCLETADEACKYCWCYTQPAVTKGQFFVGFFLGFIGYPYCIAICQSIYSKAIGPRPQV